MQLTLIYWQGSKVGVRVNRRYDINRQTRKFRDFFGDKRAVEKGVWRLASGEIYAGKSVKLDSINDTYVKQLITTSQEHGSLHREFPKWVNPSRHKA